eukprot:TRINITY_DN6849_c0_g1_i1.p1 TRINITY_DN6849_c0_g1~~TRINITY_DN6849_c0_g1_i1.p1  ORF type:complete len:267 (+),score=76.84 TRINITY_DN6849_c0_g1_i1:65-865(+)
MSQQQVRSTTASGSGSAVYESERAVEEYLQFHFGGERCMPYGFGPKEALDFAQRCGKVCVEFAREDRRRVAYDVGCAVGGTSFELSKGFEKVVGVDFSHAFIAAANRMKDSKEHPYRSTEIADIRSEQMAILPAETHPSRVTFHQGDACNLGDIGPVDCMVAANLLCRLPSPISFLQKAIETITPGGILVLVSPFSWLTEYTAKDAWIGGYCTPEGAPVDSAAECAKILSPHFDLIHQKDEPFLIREHNRKFQYGVSDCTVWRKKE